MCSLNFPCLQGNQLKTKTESIRHTPISPEGQGHLEHGRRHSALDEILCVCALRCSESQLRHDISIFRVFSPICVPGPQDRYEIAGGYPSRHLLWNLIVLSESVFPMPNLTVVFSVMPPPRSFLEQEDLVHLIGIRFEVAAL